MNEERYLLHIPQPPILQWETSRIIINSIKNRTITKKTEKMVWDEEQADFQAEKQRNLDHLNATGSSELGRKLALREAVAVPGLRDNKSHE